jgi:predicted small lipoprotein YifL
MSQHVALVSLLLCAASLGACGQKGPLYLPEKTETVIRPAQGGAAPPADQERTSPSSTGTAADPGNTTSRKAPSATPR